MVISKSWNYDYDNRCECSEDDRCGCAYPENMQHGFFSSYKNFASGEDKMHKIEVGAAAANFIAPAVMPDGTVHDVFNFFEYIAGNYALLIFYRADFSAVCPLELSAFNQLSSEFTAQGVKMAAVSVDSVPVHTAWRKTPFAQGGIGQIQIPLISDVKKEICHKYGVLGQDGLAQRASFLIDKNYTIRYQAVYDAKLERSATETKRVIEKISLQDRGNCQGIDCFLNADKPARYESGV